MSEKESPLLRDSRLETLCQCRSQVTLRDASTMIWRREGRLRPLVPNDGASQGVGSGGGPGMSPIPVWYKGASSEQSVLSFLNSYLSSKMTYDSIHLEN